LLRRSDGKNGKKGPAPDSIDECPCSLSTLWGDDSLLAPASKLTKADLAALSLSQGRHQQLGEETAAESQEASEPLAKRQRTKRCSDFVTEKAVSEQVLAEAAEFMEKFKDPKMVFSLTPKVVNGAAAKIQKRMTEDLMKLYSEGFEPGQVAPHQGVELVKRLDGASHGLDSFGQLATMLQQDYTEKTVATWQDKDSTQLFNIMAEIMEVHCLGLARDHVVETLLGFRFKAARAVVDNDNLLQQLDASVDRDATSTIRICELSEDRQPLFQTKQLTTLIGDHLFAPSTDLSSFQDLLDSVQGKGDSFIIAASLRQAVGVLTRLMLALATSGSAADCKHLEDDCKAVKDTAFPFHVQMKASGSTGKMVLNNLETLRSDLLRRGDHDKEVLALKLPGEFELKIGELVCLPDKSEWESVVQGLAKLKAKASNHYLSNSKEVQDIEHGIAVARRTLVDAFGRHYGSKLEVAAKQLNAFLSQNKPGGAELNTIVDDLKYINLEMPGAEQVGLTVLLGQGEHDLTFFNDFRQCLIDGAGLLQEAAFHFGEPGKLDVGGEFAKTLGKTLAKPPAWLKNMNDSDALVSTLMSRVRGAIWQHNISI